MQSTATPLVLANFPMGHRVHTVVPLAAVLYLPGEQSRQALLPEELLKDPGLHREHAAEDTLPVRLV